MAADSRPPTLQARAILERLDAHDLEYVVIGGVAAIIWGSPRNTADLDICPSTERVNLRRLAEVLNDLDARFRPAGYEAGFEPPAPWDERSFGAFTSLALITPLGWFDLWFRPDGTRGYAELAPRATTFDLGGFTVRVADLDDVIRSKVAAGRDKDLEGVRHLRQLQERRRERGED